MVLNAAGGVIFVACLIAGLPVTATNEPEGATLAGSPAQPSDGTQPSGAGIAESDRALAAGTTVGAPKDLMDFALANNPRRQEFSSSIAANPKKPNMLVVAGTTCSSSGCRCVVYRSHDAGRTWSQPVTLPQPHVQTTSSCNGVDVAYAPNGKRVYAAYSDNYSEEGHYGGSIVVNSSEDIVVSSSEDNGATWRRPVIALKGDLENYSYATPRIATPLDEIESRWIYVTGLRAYHNPSGSFDFTRSADAGATWSTPKDLGGWTSMSEIDMVRGNVAGGKAGEVLVAGGGIYGPYLEAAVLVARSHNHWVSFDPEVAAATEYPTSAPDVKIGHKGAAHIVYARWESGDSGDIRYIWSPGPPYTTWSEPVTVNDDGARRSQAGPSLATQRCGAFTVLHLVWEDPRLRPMADCFNDGFARDCYWDVFYARKVAKSGAGWSKNVRVSGKSSLTGGDGALSPDVAASQGRAFAVWADRRDGETDAYGSEILSGVTCP